jgi:hypothetical protein
MRQVGGRDARPVVAHDQLARRQAYRHRSLRWTELGRVIQQVPDRDLQPPGVAADVARLEIGQEFRPRPIPPRGLQIGGDYLIEPDVLVPAGG